MTICLFYVYVLNGIQVKFNRTENTYYQLTLTFLEGSDNRSGSSVGLLTLYYLMAFMCRKSKHKTIRTYDVLPNALITE